MDVYKRARDNQRDVAKYLPMFSNDAYRLILARIINDESVCADDKDEASRSMEAGDGSQRSHVFYCDLMTSYQKPHVERNHEFIRQILPKGSSFDILAQADVALLASHINSYKRRFLGDKSPR